jgi:hypothetical protein
MKICEICGTIFPNQIKIDGKYRNLKNRKNCLTCSPFGLHNTKVLSPKPDGQRRKLGKKVVSWRQRVKLKAIEYKGGKCQICDYSRCHQALEFHHLDPTQKEFALSGISRSWDLIRCEVDKCILVCANCHREIHAGIVTARAGLEPATLPLTEERSTD